MTVRLSGQFRKQYPGGATVEGSFELPADEFSVTVLFGPSGCGKTTILRAIAGLVRPEEGEIRLGEDVWFDAAKRICLSPQRRGVGMLFQEYALFPHCSVFCNIAFGLGRLPRAERVRRVGEMLDRFGLTGLEKRYPSQISGGQQQRVALARTLATRPRILALDEPLSALDEPTRASMRRELRDVLASFAVPVLLVTHDRMEAITLGDRIVVLVDGQVRQSGAVHEVFSRPCDLAIARVVGTDVVVPGHVLHVDDGVATVAVGNAQLSAVHVPQIDRLVYVCIRAEEVVLQSRHVSASSARNRLPGVVTSIQAEGPMLRVSLDCGFSLAALVTRQSADELSLQVGGPITAVLKAHAIHLIPRR